MEAIATVDRQPGRRHFYKHLTFQVLVAIFVGVMMGHWYPDVAVQLKPLGDVFIKLIKLVIAPVIFITVVTGIADVGSMRKVGRVGGKALLYFEFVTTLALALGLLVVNLLHPGSGIDTSHATLEAVKTYNDQAQHQSAVDFLTAMVPDNFVGAFVKGDLIAVLFVAVLFGAALTQLGERGKAISELLERVGQSFFCIIGMIMHVAPLGALGAMAFVVGKSGVGVLVNLGELMLCVYLTMALFIFLVLGTIAKIFNFNIFRFLRFISEEVLIVLGTSSSESALPKIMNKLERFGVARSVVGLVIPTGYSFNLDGTSIYMSMATIFIAQAYGVHLDIAQQLGILFILMLTSKGAAGVTGSGFITLAATLNAVHVVPVEGLALLLGVDRFMSEARAITNLIGNAVATVVIAKSEQEFDETAALAEYRREFEDPEIAHI